ncbi:hypothetical protein H072_6248 [Dactylellina haptotyla CBS 200.50]|uniref:C2H2-type domain-containing protein n=1 Tax=Dactylellina haptotyla (strain CBS 200.50) TaxID=1284197 RepID=S8BKC5_DACHA|nr:hypothetical protein H072_6248 [Dactylellina haptotyla CBS 200.50]
MVGSQFASELISQNPNTLISQLGPTECERALSVLADVDSRFDDYFDLPFFDADPKAVSLIEIPKTTAEPSLSLRYTYPQAIPTAHLKKIESFQKTAELLPSSENILLRPEAGADEAGDEAARVESQRSSTVCQDNQLASPSNILPEPSTLSAVISHRRPRKTSIAYSCQLCGKRFSNKKNLGFHASQDHGAAIFPCKNCDSVVTRHDNRDKHQRTCQEKSAVEETNTKRALPPSEKTQDIHSSPAKRRRVNILGTSIATASSPPIKSSSPLLQPASSFESDIPAHLEYLPSSQETTPSNQLVENDSMSPTSEISPATYGTSFTKIISEVLARMKALEEGLRELKKQDNPNGEAETTHSEPVQVESTADDELIPPAMNQITRDAVKAFAEAFLDVSRNLDEGRILGLDFSFFTDEEASPTEPETEISAMYGSDSPVSSVAVDTPPTAFSRPDHNLQRIQAQHNTGDSLHVTTPHQTRRQPLRPRSQKSGNRTRESVEETSQAEVVRELSENGFFSIIVPPTITANPTILDQTGLVPTLQQAHDLTVLRNKAPRRGSNIYNCPECPKSFTNRKLYGDHVWTKHGIAIFKCEYCPTAVTRHDNLKVHERGCLQKNKAEKRRRSVPTEEQTIRPEKRPYRVSTRNLPPMSVAPASASPPSNNPLPVPGVSPMLESPGRTVNPFSPRDQMQLDNNHNDGGILPSFPPSINVPPEMRNGDQDDRTPNANPDPQQIIASLNKRLDMANEEIKVWKRMYHKVNNKLLAFQNRSAGATKRNS